MKKNMLIVIAAVVLVASMVMARTDSEDNVLHTGKHTFQGGVDITANGWKINGTTVNTTAAELNQIDDGVATVDEVVAASDVGGASGGHIASIPSLSFTFLDDFFTINTNVTTGDMTWKFAGDTSVTSFQVTNGAGGILSFITGSTSNNETYFQYGSIGTEAAFSCVSNSGNKLNFETRFQPPTISNTAAFFVGLAAAGSSAANFITDSTGYPKDTDYIGFCSTNSTNIMFSIKRSGQGAQFITNFVDNADYSGYQTLGFTYDGVNLLTVYNGTTANSRTFTINNATLPGGVNMSPIMGMKTIKASYSPTCRVDYIWCNQER